MSYPGHQIEIPNELKIALATLSFIFLLDLAGYAGFLRRTILFVLRPVTTKTTAITTSIERQRRAILQYRDLSLQNLDLSRQIAETKVLADQAQILKIENESLRKELKVAPATSREMVRGVVVGSVGNTVRVWVEGQVKKGEIVVSEGRVVGVVSEVRDQIMTFARIGYESSKIMVKFGESNKSHELVLKNQELEVMSVHPDEEVLVQTLVLTAGDLQNIPPNIPVARVRLVDMPREAVYKSVKLEDMKEINPGMSVYVVKGEQ